MALKRMDNVLIVVDDLEATWRVPTGRRSFDLSHH
jgi:hypothetical protein